VSDALQARALREEIEQTRAELGQTVEALAARMDVKERARQAVRRGTVQAKQASLSPVGAALLAGAAAGLLAMLIARVIQGVRS
jgi:hypothetical protein